MLQNQKMLNKYKLLLLIWGDGHTYCMPCRTLVVAFQNNVSRSGSCDTFIFLDIAFSTFDNFIHSLPTQANAILISPPSQAN